MNACVKITYMIAAAQRASDIGKWEKLNIDSATESDELGYAPALSSRKGCSAAWLCR